MVESLNQIIPPTRIARFLRVEAMGGFVLLLSTITALLFANSPWASDFESIWHSVLSVQLGKHQLAYTLMDWVNDGLMTLFFFVVGLEIKREFISGELKDRRVAFLPIFAAIGGMLFPALFYVFFLSGHEGSTGWGIPMATDIAFVVGFLSLFGKRVPHGLKIFVLALAIVDDLGAILVIATVYSSEISISALILGLLGLGLAVAFNRLGVRRVPIYFVLGSFVWFAFLKSGIHPTIAGVLLGLLTPASAWIADRTFLDVIGTLQEKSFKEYLPRFIQAARETISPLERLELALHPWVVFFIVPIFALANAGIELNLGALMAPISHSVILGLFLGKPIGILLFSWLAVSFCGARLPRGVNWKIIVGAGLLCGVGFTMSIFISNLALENNLLVAAKTGVLFGSGMSALAGLTVLFFVLPKR